MISSLASILSSDFVKTVGKVIDDLVTSDEEKGELKLKFLNQQLDTIREANKMELAHINADTELMKAQAENIKAEAQSESPLARTWRPLTMLTLVAGIIMHQFGLDDAVASLWGGHGISDEYVDEYFTLVQIGLGGYVLGRSGEKIAKTMKKQNQRTFKSRKGEPQEPINATNS